MKPKKKAKPRPQITPRDVRECERFALYNANLKEQLELARRLFEDDPERDRTDEAVDAQRLAELVVALDQWLTRGGFIPARWTARSE